jgi:protein-S-isoprenylcysteine O-methyltransferase Ste14
VKHRAPMGWLEHRIPPPVVGLLAGALMWGISHVTPGLRFPFPGHVATAIAIAIAGMSLDLAALLEFRRARTTVNPLRPEKASALVTSGVFGWTRNPMYLGLAIVLVGWAVYLANAPALVGVAAFAGYLNRFQIAPEERSLEARFGAEFLRYREEVRRWL